MTSKERLEEELEKFFEVWYDYKRQPDDFDHCRNYQVQLEQLTSLLEAEVGQALSFSNVRRAYGSRFHKWILDNRLPELPKEGEEC